MKNIKGNGSRWGPGKVHVQLEIGYTPHGYVYGHDTDEPVDCKKCLKSYGQL